MQAEYKYAGRSGIVNGLNSANMAFASNTLREATFFHGELGQPLLLREALAALYQVVVSDFKYRPPDRTAFFAWLAEQDRKFLATIGIQAQQVRQQLEQLEARLSDLDEARNERLKPFHRARLQFFNHIYENEYELSYFLDPVITVHPGEIFFEAFSRDESSYARVGAKYEIFSKVEQLECGTTNIDFSAKLHGELERMRSYRRTRFSVDPGGFTVALNESAHHEKKIDLPDSWLMGFLQVHSAMTLSLTRLRLEPADLHAICQFLRTHKAKKSPRAMRYELEPGKPVRVVFEPWEHTIELSPKTIYDGAKAQSIRTWGRDRLRMLGRLIPSCRGIDVYLAGFGMPTMYVLDLGPVNFTLALSGWSDNDWAGDTKFHLLTRRLTLGVPELLRVYDVLKKSKTLTDSAVAMQTGLGVEQARSGLSYLCQVGRAMCDLSGGVFLHRDLFAEPFTAKQAAALVSQAAEEVNLQAKAARAIYDAGNVKIIARRAVSTGFKLSGSSKGADGIRVRPQLHVDHAGHIIEATCTCEFARKHQLTKGPCEHSLSLRLAHMSRLADEDRSVTFIEEGSGGTT